jgi:hypothetical protein
LRFEIRPAVDPVHDLIVIGAYSNIERDMKNEHDVKLLFFHRTDEGSVKPFGEMLSGVVIR